MENTIKPQPLIAEVLPGFAILVILACAYFCAHPEKITAAASNQNTAAVVGGSVATILVAWIVGTFLDTIRDLIESRLDVRFPVNWGYLLSEPIESVRRLDESWLAYYFLSGNMAIGLILVVAVLAVECLFGIVGFTHGFVLTLVTIVIVALVYAWNSWTLREEIRTLIGFGLPHEEVYTRIARSNAAPSTEFGTGSDPGVGVTAIRDIPKGALIFAPDDDRTIQVSANRMAELSPELRKLYEDFCPLNGGYYTCPLSLNRLTVAWYLNDSDTPNCEIDDQLRFRALRDIQSGEELFAHYSDFGE
jgi:hypothetical protein